MKLHLFRYECKICCKIYKAPSLVGDTYGEFLLRTSKGELRYLSALNSKEFAEVGDLVDSNVKAKDMNALNRAKILHHIFGIACDNSSDGSAYGIMQKPACPYCGQINIGHWGPTNPPEYIEQDVKIVTHEKWNQLSREEKKSMVDEEINKYLSEKNCW